MHVIALDNSTNTQQFVVHNIHIIYTYSQQQFALILQSRNMSHLIKIEQLRLRRIYLFSRKFPYLCLYSYLGAARLVQNYDSPK